MSIDLVGSAGARAHLWNVYATASTPPRDVACNEEVAIAALRHAAGRVCPCSMRKLITIVATALDGVLDEDIDLVALVESGLEALLGAGDLIRESDAETGQILIYLSPPLFVRSAPTTIYLVGGFPESDWPLGRQASALGPYRRVSPAPEDDELREQGVTELPMEAWLEHPRTRRPDEVIAELDSALAHAGPAGTLTDLRIVDPGVRNKYYVGRFVVPTKQTGTFLARRSRKYGADAWSYIQLVNGEPVRFVDLPQVDARFRACDEGWWVMFALDALAGRAQRMGVAQVGENTVLAFDMPVPRWVERRLTVFGQPVDRPRGSLFAHLLASEDAAREVEFLRASLWLSPTDTQEGT